MIVKKLARNLTFICDEELDNTYIRAASHSTYLFIREKPDNCFKRMKSRTWNTTGSEKHGNARLLQNVLSFGLDF